MTDNNKTTDKAFTGDVMDHDYDGIRELNNPSPYWIIALFFVTIGFAIFYAVYYFGYPDNGKSQAEEYAMRSAAFDAKIEAQQVATAGTEGEKDLTEIIAEGEKLFAEKGCVACHGMKGEGNAIGPNLTDNYWLNGCSEDDIIKIITEGKPEKGMTPYKAMMSANQIKSLTTFIQKKLVGSSPENAKDPQGEECK